MASVHYLCRQCEWRLVAEASAPAMSCENCGFANDVQAPPAGQSIAACAACGHEELYIQKDFNRATGITIVVIGAIFAPFTRYISLVVVTLIDVALYYMTRDVTVCYACRAVHRGYPPNPAQKAFDLVVHDRHVYGAAPPGAEEGHR